jgi:hypothetical protein
MQRKFWNWAGNLLSTDQKMPETQAPDLIGEREVW